MHWNGNEWAGSTPPDTKPASRIKRVAAAALEASLITALTFGLIAGTTFAAKGGNNATSGGGTISLAPLVVDKNGNGTPNFGDTVPFDVSTTSTSQPYVT